MRLGYPRPDVAATIAPFDREPSLARLPRLLALSEAQIPSAVLGVNTVFDDLAGRASVCEFRAGSSVTPSPADLAWADVVILVRGASPAERRLLVEAQRLGRRVATYLDDDLERVPPSARSGGFYGSTVVRSNVGFIVRHADMLLVCSRRLAGELAHRHGREPTLVLQPRPPVLPETDPGRSSSNPNQTGLLRIGFFGSVDHSAFVSQLLAEPLIRLRSELGERIAFVFCGAIPQFAGSLGAECHAYEFDFAHWREKAARLGVSIGLAPLPETPFHGCKYFNKYLEYASLGIAGIYSQVPPYVDAVQDGVTGLLCENTPRAWYEGLRALVDDPARRARLGRAAREHVESRYSESALRPSWLVALEPLLDHRAPAIQSGAVRISGGVLRFALDRYQVYGLKSFLAHLARRLAGPIMRQVRP